MSTNQSRIGRVDVKEAGRLVEVEFQIDGKTYPIYFRSSDRPLTANAESFVTAALLPCMKTGTDLVIDCEISQRFVTSLDTIQDVYCRWDSSLRRIALVGATPRPSPRSTENRVATFFSGGVDSFYTVLSYSSEIHDLVFIHGFDIDVNAPEHKAGVFEVAAGMVRTVGDSLNKRVIGIETNLRALLDGYGDWGELTHGAGLATVAQLLAPRIRRIYIPSSHSYSDMFPWGSHPVLDPLWSTETLEFVHHGCGATRTNKMELVAQSDVALQSLRVCYHNCNGAYNCGRCEKCLRTMISLEILGVLGRCTTFENSLDMRRVRRIEAFGKNTRMFLLENLELVDKYSGSEELRAALIQVKDRPVWPARIRERIKQIARPYPRVYRFLKRLRPD